MRNLSGDLLCPHSNAEMGVLSVTKRILTHLGCGDPRQPSRAPPPGADGPHGGQIPLTYGPVPDIA